MIIVACCRSIADVPAILRRCFTHELLIDAPEASERTQLLEVILLGLSSDCATHWLKSCFISNDMCSTCVREQHRGLCS